MQHFSRARLNNPSKIWALFKNAGKFSGEYRDRVVYCAEELISSANRGNIDFDTHFELRGYDRKVLANKNIEAFNKRYKYEVSLIPDGDFDELKDSEAFIVKESYASNHMDVLTDATTEIERWEEEISISEAWVYVEAIQNTYLKKGINLKMVIANTLRGKSPAILKLKDLVAENEELRDAVVLIFSNDYSDVLE